MIRLADVRRSVEMLDGWLCSMRTPLGYCGPISHWWASCLLYSGPMIDWRYEGILDGYVRLFCATGNTLWLERALVAGRDVVNAQLPNGQFWNSSFQIGPVEGGTPHEVAVDVGLLTLAQLLRTIGHADWLTYFSAAEKNIMEYQIAVLWNGQAFRDQPGSKTVVPNKNATTIEALLLYEELSGKSMSRYILPAAELILAAQVQGGASQHGGIVHLGTLDHQLSIGIYTARCASALGRLYERYVDPRYLDAARKMLVFLNSLVAEKGTYFGYYPNGQMIRCPNWISASGDILRAFLTLKPHIEPDTFSERYQQTMQQLLQRLIEHQHPTGGIWTAYGLHRKGSTQLYTGLPDFRDVLSVVGWCDKTFRALIAFLPKTELSMMQTPHITKPLKETRVACLWKGRKCWYREDETRIQLTEQRTQRVIYSWTKGYAYPDIYCL